MAASLTQDEFAARCGLFRTYLSRIENGTANPTLSMIHALAKTLRVSIPSLFESSLSAPQTEPRRGRPARVKSAPGTSRGRAR